MHPLTNLPPSAPGIETAFVFPDYDAKQPRFPAGANVDVVLGLHNSASQPYNISAIMGSLNSPLDFGIYVQNFTLQGYGVQVDPDGEASVLYTFRPDAALHPREFTVALTVFYTAAQGGISSTTFFNQTIEIVEPPRTIDAEIIFLWFLMLGTVGFLLYKAYAYVFKLLGGKSRGRKKAAAPSSASSDDWITGTALHLERKKAERVAAKAKAAAEGKTD